MHGCIFSYVFSRIFLVGSFTILASAALGSVPTYSLERLGDIGVRTQAVSLNELGQVVGDMYLSDGSWHAVLWNPGSGMANLGMLAGDVNSGASAINNTGQVVGFSQPFGGNPPRAFLWQAGADMIDVGAGAGLSCQPSAINQLGQVVGRASPDGFQKSNFGFIYSSTTGITPVTIPGMLVEGVLGINNLGQLVVSTQGSENVLFYSPGQTPIEIKGEGLMGGAALAMNDQGTVVGYIGTGNINDIHAYVWNQLTGMIDLTPGITSGGFAKGINELGEVVGFMGNGIDPGYPFFYREGITFNLMDQMDASGWTNMSPQDINNQGQIAGYGLYHGELHGFLMTPITVDVPEPASLTLLGIGVWGLLVKRQRN